MPVLDDHKHVVIQMREKGSDDYHYPITLDEAVKDRTGMPLPDLLRAKLLELGQDVDVALKREAEELSKLIDRKIEEAGGLTEEVVQEIRGSLTIITNKLSDRETAIAYLAANWVQGILVLDLSPICKVGSRTLYYAESVENPVEGDYHVLSTNNTSIKEYVDGQWVDVLEDVAIILYAFTTTFAKSRGMILINSSNSLLPSDGLSLVDKGNIYIEMRESTEPYLWLGTTWVPILPTGRTIEPTRSSIDALVDLVSTREITVSYSPTNPHTDFWYNGTDIISDYTVGSALQEFLISIFPANVQDYNRIDRHIYLGPRKPAIATEGDLWVDTRKSYVFRNISDSTTPVWVQQTGIGDSVEALSCTNLFEHSDRFNAYMDRALWRDIRTGSYSSMAPVTIIGDKGVQEVVGVNKSISQKVRLRPNTMYTYSAYVKAKNSSALPNMYLLADECEIVSSSLVNGSYIDSTNYMLHYITFITGSNVTESVCRFETPSGNPFYIHSPCLQEGSSFLWTASIKDILPSLILSVGSQTKEVLIYREMSPTSSVDGYLNITSNGTSVKQYVRSSWLDVSLEEYPTLPSAVESLYSVYTDSGVTKMTTSSTAPLGPAIGDYWIKDDLSVLRYTGTKWGSLSNVLASEYKVLSGRLQTITDLSLQSVFLESTINVDDFFDLASSIDPTIELFKQGTEPVSAQTGDIWSNTSTGALLRYNGLEWIPYGAARFSSIEQSLNGITSEVGEIYENGGGRNLIAGSELISLTDSVTPIYTELVHGASYVFSVQSSDTDTTSLTQYTVRLMNASHTLDYGNKVFSVGETRQIWRLRVEGVPSGITPHLVVTKPEGNTSLNLRLVKLETGHIYTDWQPSPDDIDVTIDSINNNINQIGLDLSTQSLEVDAISDEVRAVSDFVDSASSRLTTVEHTAESFRIESSATKSRVDSLEGQVDTLSSVFEFTPMGLAISSVYNGVTSDIYTLYRSNGLYFMSTSLGTDVGYVTSDGIKIKNAQVESGGYLAMGNFRWKPRPTGSLSLVYETAN